MIKNNKTLSPDFIKYSLADLDIVVISDGEVSYENSYFAPGIPTKELEETLKKHKPITTHFQLPNNILVIRFNGHVIMIDTGNGYKERPYACTYRSYNVNRLIFNYEPSRT